MNRAVRIYAGLIRQAGEDMSNRTWAYDFKGIVDMYKTLIDFLEKMLAKGWNERDNKPLTPEELQEGRDLIATFQEQIRKLQMEGEARDEISGL